MSMITKFDARPDVVGVLQEIRLGMTTRDRETPANFADAVLARFPLQELSPDDIDAVAEFLRDEVGLNINLIKRKIARAKVAEVLGFYPTNLLDFIRVYTTQFGLEPTLKNRIRVTKRVLVMEDGTEIRLQDTDDEFQDRYNEIWNPKEIDERRLIDRMKIFVEDYRLGFSEAGIERAWSEWVTQKRAGILFWLGDKVGCGLLEEERGEADQQWDLFLRAALQGNRLKGDGFRIPSW